MGMYMYYVRSTPVLRNSLVDTVGQYKEGQYGTQGLYKY